jgi:2',3'-cyclic-nucleotide 2'-phosphodiesterase (5'-nucleotidase family)
MSKVFIILILVTQINYLYFSPAETIRSKNLKEKPKTNTERKLDDLSDDIVIIHLNDVHCGFNETIGYDGFVLYRRELESKYKNVIAVDSRDHIKGGVLGSITEGEAVLEIINKIQFNVSTIGNHEFDYGIEQLHNLNSNLLNKYICLNVFYKKNKTQIFEPSRIVEVGDKKIGFIGIVTPLTFSKTYISTVRESDGTPTYDFLSNKEELYSTIQAEVDKIRNNGVNYVILLTHVGKDIEDFTSNEILSKVSGVNAILDGHTHKVYNVTSKDKDNKDIYIAQTGTKLANIGQLIIKSDGTIHSEIISEVPEPNDKTGAQQITRGKATRWVDTEMNSFINQIYNKHSEELSIQVGHSDFDFVIRPGNSSDSHTVYCRYKECTLGNLISDSFREVVESNISYVNGGAIRDNLLKGDISRKNIIDVMPFFNNLFVKEITGQAFLDALEFGVSKLPDSFGGFPQVSGCSFYVNTSFNSTVETDSDGMFIKVGGERRVSNVKINGKPLNLTQKYNLSASEFLLNGGDGFSMFSKFPTVNESIFTDSDALSHHIKYNLKGKIPSEYQEPLDRINIDKEFDDDDIPKIAKIGEFLKRNKKFLALLFLILM